MWLWLTLLTTLGFSLGHVLVKKGYADLSSAQTKALDTFFYLLILVPYALLRGEIVFTHLEILVVFGLVVGINYCLYLKGIAKGKISLVQNIYSTSPIFVLILASVFLKEKLSLLQVMLIVLIVAAAVLTGLPKNVKQETTGIKFEKWFFWGLLGALVIGINDILAKKAVDITTATTVIFLFPIIDIPVALGFLWIEKKPFPPIFKGKSFSTSLGVLINNVAALSFYEAAGIGKISLISGILGSISLLTAALAFLFLKEKIDRRQAIGIGLVSLCVSLLGLLST